MKRSVRWVLGLALIQATALGVYRLVEHSRQAESVERLGTEPPQLIDQAMPTLTVRRRGGETLQLPSFERPTLLHVWATWCPACRSELPGLLAVQRKHDVAVVAIALDRSWDDVERFLGDVDSSSIVLGVGAEVQQVLDVSALPVTFLVEADARIRLRFDGARDWTDEAFVSTYIERVRR